MFSEHQLPLGNADHFGGDNFVREGILEDAVLMDSCFVGESVRSYDGFIRCYRDTGDLRQKLAGGIQFIQMDIRVNAEASLTNVQQDGDFLKRSIARAFADAIDRQFELTRTSANRGQGIRYAQAQIVV